jgi:hypothetical protein
MSEEKPGLQFLQVFEDYPRIILRRQMWTTEAKSGFCDCL